MSIQKVQGSNTVLPVSSPDAGASEAVDGVQDNAEMLPHPGISELLSSSDTGSKIAAMMMMMSREQRDSARESRRSEERAEVAAQNAELEAMHESADAKLDAARAQAVLQIGGGVGTMGSGGLQIAGASTQQSWLADHPEAQQAPPTKLDGLATGARGLGETSTSVGGFVKACGDHAAAEHDIEAKAAANEASTAKRAQDDARDLEKDAKDLMNRVMSFYKEYVTSKEDATKAALHRA